MKKVLKLISKDIAKYEANLYMCVKQGDLQKDEAETILMLYLLLNYSGMLEMEVIEGIKNHFLESLVEEF